ncbi:hypothetical protein [Marinitoga arctica]
MSLDGLPGNLNIESMKDGISEIRNKVIARFFKEMMLKNFECKKKKSQHI